MNPQVAHRARRRSRYRIWAGWIAGAGALLLIVLVDTRSVLVTGPIIISIGLAIVFDGIRARYRPLVWLGAAHCGICLVFFLSVVIMSWQPHNAHVPFIIMGSIYVAIAMPASAAVSRDVCRQPVPGVCQQCGYLLCGLTVPRCPECGTRFELPAGDEAANAAH